MTQLRVLRCVAERGSFTAAAVHLGYTQSAVSRQAASLESALGDELFERGHAGVRLTQAGLVLLRHARTVLDELDAAEREISGRARSRRPVRLGMISVFAVPALPALLDRLVQAAPDIDLTTRDGSTPALTRAVRAGSLDLAVVTSRPPHRSPDDVAPSLRVETLREDGLLVAVPARGRFAGRTSIRAAELADEPWIATPSSAAEPMLGVWPGLPGRARIVHSSHDWFAKLRLVAAGYGITTVAESLRGVVPEGVVLLPVADVAPEVRRISAIRVAGSPPAGAETVLRCLRGISAGLG